MAYIAPGVYLKERLGIPSVSLLPGQRLPILIGVAADWKMSEVQAIVHDGTTKEDLFIDDVNVYSLVGSDYDYKGDVKAGTYKTLFDFKNGIDFEIKIDSGKAYINWHTTTGEYKTSNHPQNGQTYYVIYKYRRPSTDYNKYKQFYDFNDVLNDLGPLTSDNSLVIGCYMALKQFGIPSVGVVQIQRPTNSSDEEAKYSSALEEIKEVDYLVSVYPLTGNKQVHMKVKQHCEFESTDEERRERICYLGLNAVYGNVSTTPTDFINHAQALKSENAILVSPPKAFYTYLNTETGLGETKVFDGWLLALAVGLYKDSLLDPAASLLRRDISFLGITLDSEQRNTFFAEKRMNEMAEEGVCVIHPTPVGTVVIRDDITTDTSDIRKVTLSVITTKHYVTRTVRMRLDENFVGAKISNRGVFVGSIVEYLTKLLGKLVSDAIIEKFEDVTASVDSDNPDTIRVTYSFVPIFTAKKIFGEYTLKTS